MISLCTIRYGVFSNLWLNRNYGVEFKRSKRWNEGGEGENSVVAKERAKSSLDKSSWEQGDSGESILRSKR